MESQSIKDVVNLRSDKVSLIYKYHCSYSKLLRNMLHYLKVHLQIITKICMYRDAKYGWKCTFLCAKQYEKVCQKVHHNRHHARFKDLSHKKKHEQLFMPCLSFPLRFLKFLRFLIYFLPPVHRLALIWQKNN